MKKYLPHIIVLFVFGFKQVLFAQTKDLKNYNSEVFNEDSAINIAKTKGIPLGDLKGYVEFLKYDFSSQKALKKQTHLHSPYETGATHIGEEAVIYLQPNKPTGIGCPNLSFDQYNFNGWTGSIGTLSSGINYPIYNTTGSSIVNTAGNNVSVLNALNYHTIMSIPPSNSVYPFCVGYDSLACKVVGSQTKSLIPFISPYSFDPVSVRMNGALTNQRACRMKYITTVSATNRRLSYSFAIIFHDPTDTANSHTPGKAPYFKVTVKNEATNLELPGCTSYSINSMTAKPSDSLFKSTTASGDPVMCRKWNYYAVDLSSLPIGTNVSINFEVGGCSNFGHFGYAYVDAECGGMSLPYSNMCSGTSFANLVAPSGFSGYQWLNSSGPIAGATNDTLIVNPAVVGTTYTVNMISPGGCLISQTVSISLTTVNIINLGSSSSCAGGNSGTAFVLATGSNSVYTYTWTNTSTGAIVSNSQTATGLAPGSYSVNVASGGCGAKSGNLTVGVSPPLYSTQSALFCGNSAYIAVPGGTNYKWYKGSPPVLIPGNIGTNDTLFISTPVLGNIYTLVYTSASGCKDSIKYTLSQMPGGNAFVSNIKNVCPTNSNGAAVINLSAAFPPSYNYFVTGPVSSNIITNTLTTASTLSLSALAAGSYTYSIQDGICVYTNTFTIYPIQTNFTITPTNSVICFPIDTAILNFSIDNGITNNCSLSSSGACSTPNNIQIGFGTSVNSNTVYPAIYGNSNRNTKHQILYTAAELLAAGIMPGKITSIAFNINTISGVTTYPDFTIKMKCTTSTNLNSPTFESGLTQVYYAQSINITNGWNTYIFPTAYNWDGTDNILIDICNSETPITPTYTTGYSSNSSSPYTPTSFTSVRYYRFNDNLACSQITSNGTSANRPNIKFGNCAAPSISSYSLTVSSNGILTHNFNNDSISIVPTFISPPLNNIPTIYTITVINPNGGCVKTETVAILYPTTPATIIAVPMATTICEGSQILLSATGALSYNWFQQLGSGSLNIGATSSVIVTPANLGISTYSVYGYSPCPSSLPDIKVISVTVIPKAELLISSIKDLTKCMNKNGILTASVSAVTPSNTGTPYSYAWTTLPNNIPASGINSNSSYTVTSNLTTTFVVTVNGVCAKKNSDTVVVKNLVDNLNISILDTSTSCIGSPFTLRSFVTGGYPTYNYSWFLDQNTTPVSTSATIIANPASSGSYVITVSVNDSCGYIKTANETITVLPSCALIIPNVITPNDDGINDFFKIKNLEHHPNTSIVIFDRWGIKIFESDNYNNDWKATNLNDGTFFYVVDVPDDKKYSGFISVFHSK